MDTPLGRQTPPPDAYDPGLLAPLARATARSTMGIGPLLPFVGEDVWRAYEVSWLSAGGKPVAAVAEIRVDVASPCIVESKSAKLYLNGLAQRRFDTPDAVIETIRRDLSAAFGVNVTVSLLPADGAPAAASLPGECLDDLPVRIEHYDRTPGLLGVLGGAAGDAAEFGGETLHTHLFRALCPVTGQPDWASILLRHQGPPLDRAGLLAYLISYRRHRAFHESVIEQIFLDLKACCGCERLLVAGWFLRRGGIDINPVRADPGEAWPLLRAPRQ